MGSSFVKANIQEFKGKRYIFKQDPICSFKVQKYYC